MCPVAAPAWVRLRLPSGLVLLVAAWGLACLGRAEEPIKAPRLTAAQQKQVQQAQAHGNQARQRFAQGKRAEALQEWQKKLALERAAWGAAHVQLVPSLQTLAWLQKEVEDFAAAHQALQEVLAIQTKHLGKPHWQVTDAREALADLDRRARLQPAERARLQQANSLNQQVFQLWQAGRWRQALPLAQRAVAIRGQLLGKDHPFVALSLHNLAGLYKAQGQYGKAEPLLKRCLTIRETRLGKDHPFVALSLNNLALLYKAQGQYGKAEPLYRRSLTIRETRLGKDHPDVAQSLNNLATLYQAQGQYSKAEPLFQRSLTIYQTRLGRDHLDVATSLNNLAGLNLEQGQYAQAEPLYRRSLTILEARLGHDHPDVAQSLNNLATLYQAQGQYSKAEPLFQRSLTISQTRLGQDHPAVAQSLNNLAALYKDEGQYRQAEPLYRRSLTLLEARLGKDHPKVATSLNNLALLYKAQGQYGKAEPLFQRSLTIREARLGKDHPDVALSLNNLALVYQEQGQYGKAEPLLKRSLTLRETSLGQDHPAVATSLNNLATLYKDQGQYRQAEPLYRRSLTLLEARLGKDHPKVATSLNNLATLWVSLERWTKAVQTFDEARHGLRQHLHQVLPALAPQEQLTFLHTQVERSLHAALSLALLRRGASGLAEHSAAWLINSKALSQQALAQPLLLARAGTHPQLTALHGQLLEVRQRLARLTLALPPRGQEQQRRQQLDALTQQERRLTRELGQQSGQQLTDPGWVELAAVRKTISPDAVLIDIARFHVFDFRARGTEQRWQAARYAAWVIPPQGKGTVRLIDLGEAAPLENAVQAVRQALAAAPKALATQAEAMAEQQLRRTLDELAQRLLRPLLPHIGRTHHWLLSPDAALWLVPWAALPLADGRYALEKHTISYVNSGRDLVGPRPAASVQPALVLADPDFELLPARAARTAEAAVVQRGLVSAEALPRFARLAGTAAEAKAIAPWLQRYAGAPPVIHTGPQATEGRFKAARRPRLLVLSTHGFFLADQDEALVPSLGSRGLKLVALPRPHPRGQQVQVREHPLLRCGLALAGANQRARAGPEAEDGILTGLEIVGTDLSSTELVVLSACETGLGQVKVGEGVAGLRQAFQLAGAQAVAATLWQIPDRETTALMQAFFTQLAAKQGKAEALRQAQLEMIQQRRARGQAAHPFYWAAFTLTGQWQ